MIRHFHKGVVLIWALITLAVTTTIVGALGAYYVGSGHIMQVYMDQTATRFTGQEASERIKAVIDKILKDNNLLASAANPALGIATGSSFKSDLSNAISDIKNLIKKSITIGNYEVKFSDANSTLDTIAETGNGTLLLKAEVYAKSGGSVLLTLEEELVFKTGGTDALTTMEIFDFVYFAHNYGHLDSSVVANGDIGANDKFTISGSRVNGYVKIRGDIEGSTSAYDITDAWMWPYQSFMKRVEKKINLDMTTLYPGLTAANTDYYTQIRPTNPIYVSDTEPQIEWVGGYEAPGFSNKFGDILATGGFATDPENPNAQALAVYQKGYTNDAYSTYFDTETGNALTNPDKEEHDKYYNSTGTLKSNSLESDYNTYYNADGTAKTYPDQSNYLNYYNADGTAKTFPDQSTYLQYYNADGTKKANEYQATYNNYYNSDGSKKTNPLESEKNTYLNSDGTAKENDRKSTFEKYFYFDSNGNAQKKSHPYDWWQYLSIREWERQQSNFESNHLSAYVTWINEQKKWTNGGTQITAYNTWNSTQTSIKTSYDNWNTSQTSIGTAQSTWTSTQSSVGTAHSTWMNAQSDFATSGKKASYEEWTANRPSWLEGGSNLTAYNTWNTTQTEIGKDYAQWTSDYAKTQKDFTEWQDEYDKWKTAYLNGDEEVKLDESAAHITDTISKKIINVTTHLVEVPDLSDTNMTEYINYCKNFTTNSAIGTKGGKLYCDNQYDLEGQKNIQMALTNCYSKRVITYRKRFLERNYETESDVTTPLSRTVNKVQITNGDGSTVIPLSTPAGSEFSTVSHLEVGSVILIGTAEHPITIEGPVYIPGDVVIRGFVKGQGTIYAGRNIHIIGDITYKNPPSWPHANLTLTKNRPNEVKLRNAGSDILLLVARGNIIVGDYCSDLWQSEANMKYLKSYGDQSSKCSDFSESAIGYAKGFNRDYTQTDGGKTINVWYSATTQSWDDVYIVVNYNNKKVTWSLNVAEEDRKYYESIFGSKVISELKQTMTTDPDQLYKLPTSFWQRLSDFFNAMFSNSTSKIAESKSPNDGDILEIDSVLFANHGIFGVVGGTDTPQFTLNGAMLCRDEGLLPSFTERFKNRDVKQKIWLNWDMRIKSDSAEGLTGTGAPVSINSSNQSIDVYVKSWRQVK